MELSVTVQQLLGLLIGVTIVLLIIIAVFLVKLLIDLSSLAKSTENLVAIAKHDLGPTLKEFKRALININAITSSTSTQFKGLNTALNDGLNAFSNSTRGISDRARVVLSSVKQGILTGLKVFMEEKKNKY